MWNRRACLQQMGLGFGGIALDALLSGSRSGRQDVLHDHETVRHTFPRAKRVIFLFMHGGPSHIDLFDPKPLLARDDGKPLPFDGSRVTFADRGNLMKSPWQFHEQGDAGIPMSELWEHLPSVSDELCMIHSMCDTNVAHGGACMKLHTGSEAHLRPSMGSWISYGLGSENDNLPSFITICPTSLHGGVDNFGSAFLPAIHNGIALGTPGYPNAPAENATFEFLTNDSRTIHQQRLQLNLLRELHDEKVRASETVEPTVIAELDARIQSYELAFRMQLSAPEAIDYSEESESTFRLYGIDGSDTDNFGRQCLLARRFAERGVRFIQVSHAGSLPFNNEQWDQHTHLVRGHEINVRQIDRPITGLLLDLKQRGLLEDTLVVWGGEFGRTPTVQSGGGEVGRDHHPEGFTMWLAGGGVKRGFRYGATDDYGYYAIENRCTIHDFHATVLHLLGLDHERLTWHHDGRDYRLTDVFGSVAHEIIA